jgi:hypothetical protein
MSLPTSESVPDDFNNFTQSQKRRIRYAIKHASVPEIDAFLANLRRGATPNFEFFLFGILAAFISAAAIILDSPLLLVAAILTTPFPTPLIGLALSPIIGNFRFFLQSTLSALILWSIFFLIGFVAGLLQRIIPTHDQFILSKVVFPDWISWIALLLSSILTGVFSIRHDNKPLPLGKLLSYLIFVPAAVSGFLGASIPSSLFMKPLFQSLLFLFLSGLIISAIFFILGLKTRNFAGTIILITIIILAGTCLSFLIRFQDAKTEFTSSELPPSATQNPNISITNTPTHQKSTPTATEIILNTPTPSKTITLTATSTPIYALVSYEQGVVIRESPDSKSKIISSAMYGTIIEMLNETELSDGQTWVKVITPDGQTGWMLISLLATVTPVP